MTVLASCWLERADNWQPCWAASMILTYLPEVCSLLHAPKLLFGPEIAAGFPSLLLDSLLCFPTQRDVRCGVTSLAQILPPVCWPHWITWVRLLVVCCTTWLCCEDAVVSWIWLVGGLRWCGFTCSDGTATHECSKVVLGTGVPLCSVAEEHSSLSPCSVCDNCGLFWYEFRDGCFECPHLFPILFSLAFKQESKSKRIHPQIQVQRISSNPEHDIHWIRFSGSVDVAFAGCLWLSWFLTNKWLPSGSLMQRQQEGLLESSFGLCCKGEFLLNFSIERMLCNSGEVGTWSCREGEEQFVGEAPG